MPQCIGGEFGAGAENDIVVGNREKFVCERGVTAVVAELTNAKQGCGEVMIRENIYKKRKRERGKVKDSCANRVNRHSIWQLDVDC